MDTTQVKSDFNGFGPLSNVKTTASVGYQDAFAPAMTAIGGMPARKPTEKIELYSSNSTRTISQKFEVNVDYHENKSTMHLGDDATGSPQVIFEADTDNATATMTSWVDNDNVTYVDAGVITAIAGGISCNIDPSGLPSDALFTPITFATPSGGSQTVWVLGAV
jgi:hypothetical protein